MQVELIPVLELSYEYVIPAPDQYPYWQYPDVWSVFRKQNLKEKGFEEPLDAYLPGSAFYRPSDLSDNDLALVVADHTQGLRSGEHTRERSVALYGGYALRLNGEDKYFPQCCGDLSDIHYWQHLANGQETYYEGHPAPGIILSDSHITLDFTTREYDEPFQPTPSETLLRIEKAALQTAVSNVLQELDAFAQRLIRLNQQKELSIERIDDLLIFQDGQHG